MTYFSRANFIRKHARALFPLILAAGLCACAPSPKRCEIRRRTPRRTEPRALILPRSPRYSAMKTAITRVSR